MGGRDAIDGVRNGAVIVRVTAAPEKGKANEAVRAVLSAALRIPRGDLEIVMGQTSADKVVLARGVTPEELAARLELLWSPTPGRRAVSS
jgi:uncharacterized protein YggU (UPF0235/DUF167 family)